MAPLGFTMIFGNEDLMNWHFWKFIVKEYPIINQVIKMVIIDQDMGAHASIRQVLHRQVNFIMYFTNARISRRSLEVERRIPHLLVFGCITS
jgi:hypothetical protein